jgi:hypothetical protein
MNGIRQARRAGVLLAIGLLTAACSSGSPSPSVASAPSSATAGNTGSASPSQSASSGMAVAIAYAQCMRSHGISDFPDPQAGPNGQGAGWLLPAGLNMTSPQFQAAEKSCGPMPNLGGSSVPPLTEPQQRQYLRWAACIRAHGVPSFKDPTFPNGYPQFTISGDGAQMQAAQQACASYLRGIPGAGSGTVTSGGGQ